MKEFNTKEFADELKCSPRTVENWRSRRNGKLMPAHTDEHGQAVYTEAQLENARALLNRNKKKSAAGTIPSLFDNPTVKVIPESTPEDKPVEENHTAQIESTATIEAVNEPTAELIIDDEFQSLIPPLADNERAQLEENLLRDGIQDSLKTWQGILIDGHNRYSIAQKHGLTFKTTEMQFDDRDAVKRWIIENQFGRRNINRYSRGELALKLEPSIAAQAKANQGARTDLTPTPAPDNLLAILPTSSSVNVRDELAKIAGVSPRTMAAIKFLAENASEEIKTALRHDTITINAAYEAVKAGAMTVDDVTEFKAGKKTQSVTVTEPARQVDNTESHPPKAQHVDELPTNDDSDGEKLAVNGKPLDSLKQIVIVEDSDDYSEHADATEKNQPHELDTATVENTPAQIDDNPTETNSITVDDKRAQALTLTQDLATLINAVTTDNLTTAIEILETAAKQLRELETKKLPATTDAGGKDI